MNSENKDWEPEVGKTAWILAGGICQQVSVVGTYENLGGGFMIKYPGFGERMCPEYLLHSTAESALESIKAYDLKGKRVVIPRARVDLPDHTHLLHSFHGVCTECGKVIQADHETWESLGKIAKLAYTMESPCDPVAQERLRKAQERFSQDRREGGC